MIWCLPGTYKKEFAAFRRMAGLLTVILLGCLCAPAYGEDTREQETPVFSNRDLQRYGSETPSAAIVPDGDEALQAEKGKGSKASAKKEKEQQYWCRKAKPYRKAVAKTSGDLKEAEEELTRERARNLYGNKRITGLEARVNKLKRKSRAAEEDLAGIENEAYRKGIPAGWLRCQFE